MLFPFGAVIALLILFDSSGGIFYRQIRVGRQFRNFYIYKFRTMYANVEKSMRITVRQDRRVTRVGRILRKYKFDEIPQLINVLRGEMSFVGPRPELPALVDGFRSAYAKILSVRPGITCPASLYFRCEEQLVPATVNPVEFHKNLLIPQKMVLDQMYIEKCSVFYDIYLIVLTVMSCINSNVVQTFDRKCYAFLQEKKSRQGSP